MKNLRTAMQHTPSAEHAFKINRNILVLSTYVHSEFCKYNMYNYKTYVCYTLAILLTLSRTLFSFFLQYITIERNNNAKDVQTAILYIFLYGVCVVSVYKKKLPLTSFPLLLLMMPRIHTCAILMHVHILCCSIIFSCNQLSKWRPTKCYATYPICRILFLTEAYFLRAIFTLQTQYLYCANIQLERCHSPRTSSPISLSA